MVLDIRTYFRIVWLGTFGGPRFHLKRALTTILFALLLAAIATAIALTTALDHLFFPGFRKQKVEAPLFIVGNPRSGTTFFHYLLCLDEQRFRHQTLWQTIFSTVLFDKFLRAFSYVDRALFRVFSRGLTRFEKWVFRGWDGIHQMGFQRAEECEATWCMACFTPSIYLLCPWISELEKVKYLDQLPDKRRELLMRYYHRILKRQIYIDKGRRTFLGKNVFHTGRMRSLLREMPDMRFVHLVRHPYDALPSLLSMFTKPWRAHSPDIAKDSDENRAMAEMGVGYYHYMEEVKAEIPPEQIVTLTYDELMAQPKQCIERVYAHFGMEMSDEFTARIDKQTRAAKSYKSRHGYSIDEYGISDQWVYDRLQPIFETYGFER